MQLKDALMGLGIGMIGGASRQDMDRMTTELMNSLEDRATELRRGGRAVTLPEGMPLQQGISFLQRKLDLEEKTVDLSDTINACPMDGAHALMLVISETFGFAANESTTIETMFGPMEFDPKFVTLQIGPSKSIEVPWGNFSLPGIEGTFMTATAKDRDGRTIFALRANIKGRHRPVFEKLVSDVKEKLKTSSIYKGKAIKIEVKKNAHPMFGDNLHIEPEFMPLRDAANPLFNRDTTAQVENSILTPIIHTDRLRKNGLPIKRTVMVGGDYGVGKTLLAKHVAQTCEKNGWTFLYVKNVDHLSEALKFAEQYAPCLVFAEDADEVLKGERDGKMNSLSTELDGIDTKAREVMLLMTSNDVESIAKLMMRPGRIDDVIMIGKPDADTCYRLLQQNADKMLMGDEAAFREAIAPMAGHNPAFLSEVVKKSKLRAVSRSELITLSPEDIKFGVLATKAHIDLMNKSNEPESHQDVPLTDAFIRVTGRNLSNTNGLQPAITH